MPSLIVKDWVEVLLSSSEEVLETMFFCSILRSSSGTEQEETVSAKLRFEGIPSGTFTICASTGAAREMSATFLGIEPDQVTENQLDQVVGELANMVCGNAMSRAALGKTLSLTHPEIFRTASSFSFQSAINIRLEIEKGLFEAFIEFDSVSSVQYPTGKKARAIQKHGLV